MSALIKKKKREPPCSQRLCLYLSPHLDRLVERSLCPLRSPGSSSLCYPFRLPHSYCSRGDTGGVRVLTTCQSGQHFHSYQSDALLRVSHRLTGPHDHSLLSQSATGESTSEEGFTNSTTGRPEDFRSDVLLSGPLFISVNGS